MARALARTRKRYTPLDLAYSSSVSGALNQNYDASYQTYDPDRGLIPLEILFTVRATDPKKVIDPGIINGKLTDVRWYENVVDEAHNITDGNTAYVIDRNGNSDSRGKLTVKKNTPLEGVVLIFTAKYTDPRNGKVVNVNATISLGVTVSTDEPLRVKVDYPYGQVVDPTENRDFVEIDNILYRGDEEYEGSIYRWLKKEGGDYTAIEEGDNGITGTYTGKLKVPCPVVGKRLDLRCIADVLPDLAGVNLVSKAMISDDWNALSAGTSTPGEDADGKHFIINQRTLYETFNHGKGDIFSGKIKYKPNQRYRLDVRWKMQGEQEHSGLMLVINYTSGSSNESISISGNQTSLVSINFITPARTTIDKITVNYGSNVQKTNIYDLNLVEYHGDNLVEGGSKERLVNSSFIHKFTSVPAKNYSVRFDKSETIEATGVTSRSFQIYDRTAGARVSSIANVNDGEVGVITVNDDIDPSHEFGVVAYAKQGTSGGSAKFYDLMLVEGEYTDETMPAYTPSPDEFVPAIADGGERWQELSGKEITTNHVLSTQYPRCNTEIVAPSMILDETSLFEARVVMHSSRGDIENPQLYWGFPWRDKTGAIFARGSKIFIKEEQFDNGEFDYSVDPVEGLAEAKWAANFNGIDQYLMFPGTVGNHSPLVYKRHVLDFIISMDIETLAIMVDYHYNVTGNDTTGKQRLSIRLDQDNKLSIATRNKDVTKAFAIPNSLLKGKLYRLEIQFTANGDDVELLLLNGSRILPVYTSSGIGIESSGFGLGGYAWSAILNCPVIILKYEFWHHGLNDMLLSYDFQPVDGDRSKMLANKGTGGDHTLIPVNVPGIDDVNPGDGFFVTI